MSSTAGKRLGIGDVDLRSMMEDFFFDGEFIGIGQLESVGAKELDAVILPGIVRGGDDNARVEAVSTREERHGRRGDDARAFDRGSGFTQSRGEGGGDPRTRFARIAAQKNLGSRRGLSKRVGEGEADGVDGCWVERSLACDGANAVGAEELACVVAAHDFDFLPLAVDLGVVDSTRLVKEPSASRVVSWSPDETWAVDRTTELSAARTSA